MAGVRRVLIVEDEHLQAAELQKMVEDSGFRVAGPVSNVAEALKLIEEGDIGAAILDVRLHQGEAVYPVALALRDKDVPFIFATGYDRTQPRDNGFHELTLSKPFDALIVGKILTFLMT